MDGRSADSTLNRFGCGCTPNIEYCTRSNIAGCDNDDDHDDGHDDDDHDDDDHDDDDVKSTAVELHRVCNW